MRGLVDKTLSSSKKYVRSGAEIVKTGGRFAHDSLSTGTNYLVMYTPSIYDSSRGQDTTDTTKVLSAYSLMATRSAWRMTRMPRYHIAQHQAEKTSNKISFLLTDKQRIQQHINSLKNKNDHSNITQAKLADAEFQLKKVNEQINRYTKQSKDQYAQASMLYNHRFSATRSTKAILSNTARRTAGEIQYSDGFGNQVIGTVAHSAWMAARYQRHFQAAVQKTYSAVKSITASVIAILSAPTTIIAAVGILPFAMIMILIVSVVAIFSSDIEYSGRVREFSYNEIRLENAYQTALVPDEVLAITQVLGWTTSKEEDYEKIISLMLDQERGDCPSFHEMMVNIFLKYNPALILPNTYDPESDTGFTYWYNDEFWFLKHISNATMSIDEWLNLYPAYLNADPEKRLEMASKDYVKQQMQKAFEVLKINGANNIAAFMETDPDYSLFEAHVIDSQDLQSSSAIGYRTLHVVEYDDEGEIIDEYDDNSFHHGADIPASRNTDVHTPMDGVVVYADGDCTDEGEPAGLWNAGNSVIIRHEIYDEKGNISYFYTMMAHLEPYTVLVENGDRVSAGDVIGGVGTTGYSTGPHLHLQCWITNQKIDHISSADFPSVHPSEFSDSTTGDRYDLESDDYCITIDGTMLFDVDYRNMLYGR